MKVQGSCGGSFCLCGMYVLAGDHDVLVFVFESAVAVVTLQPIGRGFLRIHST